MISHDNKVFFIHIPKCAGRSVIELFNQRSDHFTAMYYATEYVDRWIVYNRFSIVRNPYDRLVSIWSYLQQHRRQNEEPVECPGKSFKEWCFANFNALDGTFRINSAEAEWGTDYELGSRFWFSPQVRFLMQPDNNRQKITIFRMEDGLDKVSDYMYGVLGMNQTGKPMVKPEIRHVNKSQHDHYSTYYDDELLSFVNRQKFIEADTIAFRYKFEKKQLA